MARSLPQGREQELVRSFFGGARSGFFVEVGANRPQQESQTWHLESLGWTGVLIEAQPALADELRRTRRAKVFAVACSAPQNAGKHMRLHVAGALSALDRDRMAPGAEPEQVIEVPARTLDELLVAADAPAAFELLSVDVEGHELEVLSGFDFARWRPRLIARGPCRQSCQASDPQARRLPADPPLREQWLVCSERYRRGGHAVRTLGDRAQVLSRVAFSDRAQCLAYGPPPLAAAAQVLIRGLTRRRLAKGRA